MTGMEFESHSVEETIAFGRELGELVMPGDVVELTGELGAGKTHLTKGVAEALGVFAPITSPTFNIIYEYHEGRMPLFHFDLYRLESDDELDDIAYWELLEDGGVCLVEWGDKFPESMPDDYLQIDLSSSSEGTRRIDVTAVGARGQELAAELEHLHAEAHA